MVVYAVRDAVGRLENMQSPAAPWINGLKVRSAALPLGEHVREVAVETDNKAEQLNPEGPPNSCWAGLSQ